MIHLRLTTKWKGQELHLAAPSRHPPTKSVKMTQRKVHAQCRIRRAVKTREKKW